VFLNHETTKKREFHEIFESQIPQMNLDFSEKIFYGVISSEKRFNPFAFFFFRVFVI